MINFGTEICTNFAESSSREWLETNGIGGFACGTVSGVNTRRYHGLLTAATKPPLGRITILSKFEESLVIDGKEYQLSANEFPGGVFPKGFEYLINFRLDPFPIWLFEIDGLQLEKKVFMVHGQNTTVCRWSLLNQKRTDLKDAKVELILRPLLSFVDYHSLQHAELDLKVNAEISKDVVSVRLHNADPLLHLRHNGGTVKETGTWYNDFEYAIEKERGFDFHEDLFQPFTMTFDLSTPAKVVATLDVNDVQSVEDLEMDELFRRETLINDTEAKDDLTAQLITAADQFVVSRGDGKTIIAGYPWFSDWGRDTMIALSGLTLETNRPEIARNILLEYSKHISQGMIPNRFPDVGDEADYNTVDATLWYVEAIRAYAAATGDYDFVHDTLYEKLAAIIVWHLRGTRFNIHVDTDGLLFAGEPGVQLTWMDAKIGDLVITPRSGKAVEIQALWYNALRIMAGFAERFGDDEDRKRYDAMADLCKLSFNSAFWNEEQQCLYDVVVNGNRDGSVRPNQIFAVSLEHSMLDPERSQKVVEKVEAELLTPVGLRSLSPKDKDYCPIYIGSPLQRDSSYHQGTVWAWPIGAFVDAYRKVFGKGDAADNKIKEIIAGFQAHISEAGVGQISEIFDGDPPHTPRGCFAQAWSVAEVLRILNAK